MYGLGTPNDLDYFIEQMKLRMQSILNFSSQVRKAFQAKLNELDCETI